jgi:drug/metabolite transporter (DMT)-like permease
VTLGASLWATDSLFRAKVAHSYSVLAIVLMNHLLLLPPALVLGYQSRHELRRIKWPTWLSLAVIGGGGSVAATVAFTLAFVSTNNYSVPVLVQKLQPCFAFVLARILLGEALPRRFWWFASLGILGAYLLAFGASTGSWQQLGQENLSVFGYALVAAAIWGASTVLGRLALRGLSFKALTAARFILGTAAATLALAASPTGLSTLVATLAKLSHADGWAFVGMAYLSGLIPMLIYYRGLATTTASVATLCELSFPLMALSLNWLILGARLDAIQLTGAVLIVVAITSASWRSAATSARA